VPSTFIPSVEEREGAMELGQSQSIKSRPVVTVTVMAGVTVAVALTVVLLWR
jgi:hypothetical protein